MTDPLSLRQCAFTHALALLIIEIGRQGYQVKVQELNRLVETQKEYIAKGVSKTMNSRHLDNLAADLILFKNGILVDNQESYRPFGEYWESLGGRWGGRFGYEDQSREIQNSKLGWDCDHFEFRAN